MLTSKLNLKVQGIRAACGGGTDLTVSSARLFDQRGDGYREGATVWPHKRMYLQTDE